jgi:hypothetical protein
MSNEPTPRTDEITKIVDTIRIDGNHRISFVTRHAKQLELELTKVTKQRDALAEALRKLTEYDLGDIPVGIVRNCNEALQSLTTNEL